MKSVSTGLLLGAIYLLMAAGCRDTSAVGTPGTALPGAAAPGESRRPSGPEYVRLTEQTQTSGVHFAYDNGRAAGFHTIIESLGGGIGLFDYDNDGRHDLFCPGGGKFDENKITSGLPSALFRNLGQWQFTDVTAPTGVAQAPHLTHGCAAADYDADGFTDLLVTGFGGLMLFHNQGDGTFMEAHEAAGMHDTLWSSSAAWADFNGDQHLDLYVDHYVNWSPDNDPACPGPEPGKREICSPRRFDPLPDVIYYGNGDGTFRDATSEARLNTKPHECGKGLGVVVGDLDLDGDVDIYVANDTVDNFLYLNDGHGVFEEVGLFHGVARDARGKAEGSMGVDLGDYDLDGLPDIWVANFEEESFSLYRNDLQFPGTFVHVSQGTGITALGRLFVAFGTVFADIDRDGDEDFVVANGHVINYPKAAPIRQEPLVLINDHGRFAKAVFAADGLYFSQPHRGRGLASSDLDDDGDLDFVFSHNDGEPNALVANNTPPIGGWLRVRLIGVRSNRDAIGARLVLHTTAGDQLRLIKGGGSYESQSDLRPFWGIPAQAKVQGLTIHWPAGDVQEYPLTKGDQSLTIVEPAVAGAAKGAEYTARGQ